MLNKLRKHFVSTDYQNENGFTFISMLFMIIILTITIPMLGYLIQATNQPSSYDELSIQQFFQFLRDEVIRSEDVYINSGNLYMKQSNGRDTAKIEQYESLIRRQVNNLGHEIYLRNIEDVTFTEHPYGIHATVTSVEGEQYEKTIIFYD